ncbi:hypothetical protein [Microbispora bryophytorum]|uniref:hypothetical protein n=1 Tax=Microbispora bryophytorum TaxID=1460882 RepID=UPI0033E733C0
MKTRSYSSYAVMAGMVTAAFTGIAATPTHAASADSTPYTITLRQENQPKISRPTLDELKAEAKRTDTSLENALDQYVAKIASKKTNVATANPDHETNVQSHVLIDDLSLAELTDLKLIAKSEGISFEEAIDRYGPQTKIDDMSAVLAKVYPDTLAGVEITNNGHAVQIGFKGEIPSEAIDLAKKLPVEVQFTGNKGFSQAELRARLQDAHKTLAGRPDVAAVDGQYDFRTGVISFQVQPKLALKAAAQQQLAQDLQPPQPENKNISIKLEVEQNIADQLDADDTYIRGGGKQTIWDTGAFCTSGFNVTNGTYYRTTAAAHCARDDAGGGLAYINGDEVNNTFTGVAKESVSSSYDLARYSRGNFVVTRTFYYDWTFKRYVYDWGTYSNIGDRICRFGRKTGATCSHVKQVGAVGTGDDGRRRANLLRPHGDGRPSSRWRR